MLERFNQELKRLTRAVGIFPYAESCLRLLQPLAAETQENGSKVRCHSNMQPLAEHQEALRQAA